MDLLRVIQDLFTGWKEPVSVVGTIVSIVSATGAFIVWIYRRGEKEGERRAAARINGLTSELASSRKEVDDLAAEGAALRNELAKGRSADGNSLIRSLEVTDNPGIAWVRGPELETPPPPPDRHPPVIAVFNLKGGVGKTTITGNIAAAVATSDTLRRRVLLIDTDWQGTLTGWMMPAQAGNSDYDELIAARRTFDRFLDGTVENNYLNCSTRVRDLADTRLIGADGRLGDGEDISLLRWFDAVPGSDPRFKLRRWLQQESIRDSTDLVLVDCPPRLTAASICALMAADYVLIPVIPDAATLAAVPILLTLLRSRFRAHNHHLNILAVVVNRAGPHGLRGDQVLPLRLLHEKAKAVWGAEVPVWREEGDARGNGREVIRSFNKGAGSARFAALDDSQRSTFSTIASKIIQTVKHS